MASTRGLNGGVIFYSVSPDGEFVFVETSSDAIIAHSFVLDSSGSLVADLGKNSTTAMYDMLWQFNNGKRMMLYKEEKLILSEISSDRFSRFFVLNLDGKNLYPFKDLCDRDRRKYARYTAFNNRTLEFAGIGHSYILKESPAAQNTSDYREFKKS